VHVTVVVGFGICAIAHQGDSRPPLWPGKHGVRRGTVGDLSPFEFFWSTKSSVTARGWSGHLRHSKGRRGVQGHWVGHGGGARWHEMKGSPKCGVCLAEFSGA
jgi:hypothetical protein